MYTRAYNDERGGIIIPDSYGGTALYESASALADTGEDDEKSNKNPWEEEKDPPVSASPKDIETEKTSFFSKLHIPDFLPNIFKNANFGLQKLGKEEILIIATAAFLFFSKEGDKECALMLLLLLFLS